MTFPAPPSVHLRPIEQILDLARWAPSGDNTQPWRFEIVDDLHVVVHGFDTREHCVYDLDGHPSQLSIGALIETAAIAASAHGWRMESIRRRDSPETRQTFDLSFEPDESVRPDPLIDAIRDRSVQRRPLKTRLLTSAEKAALEAAVGEGYKVEWLDTSRAKWRMATLLFRSAKLRLTMPEAYRVHRDIIQWNARFSPDRVPDQALGVDRMTLHLMRFVMHSWKRVEFFNAFMAGTWIPRLQMDLLPALACGAHFFLCARSAPVGADDYVAAGRAVQRFWLAATRLGLMLQPELTPLIFTRYARKGMRFSSTAGMTELAEKVASRLESLVSEDVCRRSVFVGRVGEGPSPTARSTRLEVDRLMVGVGNGR